MATLYGVLIGTPKNAVPPLGVPNTYENGRQQIIARDRITLAAAAINDLVELARNLPWETVLDPHQCVFSNAALGASTTISIGDGATYPAALASAVATSSAATGVNALSAVTIGNHFKPLWAQIGYASLAAAKAVSPACTLYAKIGGAAATGLLTWQFHGVRRMT